ncbi:MAG: AraC family ligand binding domain-containing protein, partial [Chloroflexota bacterium]
MSEPPIPTFQFSSKHLDDIPFQIMRFEELPDIATQAFPRRRAFYEIFWITDGTGVHHIDFEAYSIIPNTLYFLTPGQVSFWELQGETKGYSVLFTQDFMATNLLEHITLRSFDFYHSTMHRPIIHIDDETAWIFTAICDHMFNEYHGSSFGRYSLLQCQLITFMIHAQRHYQPISPTEVSAGDKLIIDYLRLIDDHFHEVQSIKEYA